MVKRPVWQLLYVYLYRLYLSVKGWHLAYVVPSFSVNVSINSCQVSLVQFKLCSFVFSRMATRFCLFIQAVPFC